MFAASPTSTAPDTDRVRTSAYAGMPTSLRTPVPAPRLRCARKPRSSPLQRSSARPRTATGATGGCATPTSQPTSGRRRPRWFVACGPNASRMSRSWRPRWRKPAASRPVARCSRSSSSSTEPEPCPRRVRRHPRLHAEAGRDGEADRPRRRREVALARERLARLEARREPHERARDTSWRSRTRRLAFWRRPQQRGRRRCRRAAAGRRAGPRRRGGSTRAALRAPPGSTPGPCRGAAGGAPWRRPPPLRRRSRRRSRRRRR